MAKDKPKKTKLKRLRWQLNKVGTKLTDGTYHMDQPIFRHSISMRTDKYGNSHYEEGLVMTLRGRIEQRILTLENTK